jgi:hypothetical protein
LGLTFMDEDGNTAPGLSTWQFNFKFSLTWVTILWHNLSSNTFLQ